jgi:hypothetical protein
MKESNKIRFIATNYVNLQGLRNVPFGISIILLALLTNSLLTSGLTRDTLWDNGLAGGAKYYVIGGVILVSMIVSLFLIDKYYFHYFGRVKRTPESSRFEGLIQIVGSILLLVALFVDITFRLPVSCIGLVFAAVLIAEYLRLTWLVGGRFLIYYPLGALITAFVSILPLFGITRWWLTVGLVSKLIGIEIVVGVFMILAGVWGHLFLLRVLSPRLKVNNDHTI